jgi:TatA/E family protein of Tat protein translocase
MFGPRLPELLIILVVLVLSFGAKKLPGLGDSLGKGIAPPRGQPLSRGAVGDPPGAPKLIHPGA